MVLVWTTCGQPVYSPIYTAFCLIPSMFGGCWPPYIMSALPVAASHVIYQFSVLRIAARSKVAQ